MTGRFSIALLATCMLAALGGCEPSGPVTTKGVLTRNPANPPLPPPPPGSQKAESTQRAVAPAEASQHAATDPAAAESSPALSPAESSTSSSSSTPSGKPYIRLSVGLALPQTLPDGTQVGVSVDYKILGNLKPSVKYLWVIQTAKNEVAMEVQLSPQGGNLANFLPYEIRPEHGPFKARIDEVSTSGSRACASNVEPLE
jgi:hypothetical protein